MNLDMENLPNIPIWSHNRSPVNDNIIFKICTKGTSIALFVAACYVACTHFSAGAFKYQTENVNNTEMLLPNSGAYRIKNESFRQFYVYYPYIVVILFMQVIISYLPRYLWNLYDNGRMKVLSKVLDQSVMVKLSMQIRNNGIVEFINESLNPQMYAYVFFGHELLVFVITIGQIHFMNYLLDYEFYLYPFTVLISADGIVDAMRKIFPDTVLCDIINGRGDLMSNKTCVLTLNGDYAVIYLNLWIWFFTVGNLATIVVIYRFVTFLSSVRSTIGDFFILKQLKKNVSTFNYADISQSYIDALVN